MNQITITFRDEGHLRAHLDHFTVPLDTALGWAREALGPQPRSGWAHFDFECPQPVGVSGLAVVHRWTRGDFWAPRRGRTLPSHLMVGTKRPTRRLCVWGQWAGGSTFELHTLYPGRVAPREIHDPDLPWADLPQALRFWTRHAIVVAPGEWES